MLQYVRIISAVSRAAGVFSVLLLISALIVVCQMVVLRYGFGASTIWQTEYVIYSIVAATFLGSAHVLILKGHVNVDLLPNALGPRGRFVLGVISSLLSLLFCAMLAGASWLYFHEAWAGGWTTPTVWAPPLWILLLPLPLGMTLMCLQYVAEIWKLKQETLA